MAAVVRKLPTPKPDVRRAPLVDTPSGDDRALALSPIAVPTPRPAVVTSLAPERYKVQFTVSRETHDKFRRAQDLLRHTIPNGDPAAIFDRALTLLLEDPLESQAGCD